MSSWAFGGDNVQRMEDDFLHVRLILFSFDRTERYMIWTHHELKLTISMLFQDTSLCTLRIKSNLYKLLITSLNLKFQSSLQILQIPGAFLDPWNLRLSRKITFHWQISVERLQWDWLTDSDVYRVTVIVSCESAGVSGDCMSVWLYHVNITGLSPSWWDWI